MQDSKNSGEPRKLDSIDEIRIEIPEHEVNAALMATVKLTGAGMQVPGFRPGKAPASAVVQRLDARTREDAWWDIVDRKRVKILDQLSPTTLVMHNTPVVEIVKHSSSEAPSNSRTYSLRYEVCDVPDIDLGQLELTRPHFTITDEDVVHWTRMLHNSFPAFGESEAGRVARFGDCVRFNLTCSVNGNEVFDSGDVVAQAGRSWYGATVSMILVGASAGEIYRYRAELPPALDPDEHYDEEDEGEFMLRVLAVAPPLPSESREELAMTGGFADVDEMLASGREILEAAVAYATRESLHMDFTGKLGDLNRATLPPQAVWDQATRLRGSAYSDWKSPRYVDAEELASAEHSLRVNTAFQALVRQRGIEPTEDQMIVARNRDWINPKPISPMDRSLFQRLCEESTYMAQSYRKGAERELLLDLALKECRVIDQPEATEKVWIYTK